MPGLFDAFGKSLDTLHAITLSFLVIASVAVALRVYVRAYLTRNFGLDDWSMLLCWSLFTSCGGIALGLFKAIYAALTTGEVASNFVIVSHYSMI